MLLVIALADVLYQRWKYGHDMMMTTEEVKQEHRDTEGPGDQGPRPADPSSRW